MKNSAVKELLAKLADELEKEEPEAVETEKEVVEEEVAKEKEEAAVEEEKISANLTNAVNALGNRIAESLKEAKGLSNNDAKSLKNELFGNDGTKSIEFQPMNVLANMVKTYKTTTDPATKKEAGDNIIVNFFKAWVNYGETEEATKVYKALVEGTAADGGHLVPTPLATEVWRILPDLTVMRKIARTIPMSSLTLDLNSLTANPEAYWVSEYAKKTTTSAEFSEKVLTAYKLVCLLPISHELLADANINLANLVIELFAERIARKEDQAFFTGTGTAQPRGIDAEALTTVTAGGTFNFDDIIDTIYSVPQYNRESRRAAFVGNRYAIQTLRKVKDTNGDYIWRDGGMFGGEIGNATRPVPTLYGYPFYEQNDIAQKKVFFGDWSYYIIGDRQQITVSKTNEGGDAWRRDSTEFKAVERVGGRAVMLTPFAELQF